MELNNKQTDIWVAVQGATIGKSHIQDNCVCQDKTFVYETSNALAVALADGAGSAKLSHYGAETVTRKVCKLLCERFDEFYNSNTPMPVKNTILSHLLKALQDTAIENQCELSDLASTLLAVVISNKRFLIIHLGDGVIAYTKDDEIKVASSPKNGEFANTTYFVTSSCALEMMKLVKGLATSINGFILMSDGSEASLYSKQRNEVAPVLQRLIKRLGMTSPEYLQPVLEASLKDAIAKKTRDDCSLILVSKHLKAYDELDDTEVNDYFGIKAKRPSDAKKRKIRYQDILNALETAKSDKELCELMGLKNTRNFIKTWLAPLEELGYIVKMGNNVYKRTIHPRCSFLLRNNQLIWRKNVMNRDTIITDELWTPREAVLPVCLCIDTSGTMATTIGGRRTGKYVVSKDYGNQLVEVVEGGTSRVEILEKGIQKFYDAIFADEVARLTVLVSIVIFNDKAKRVQNFVPVVKQDGQVRKTPHFIPQGETAMGEGINMALDLLDRCKKKYKSKGVDCYQPWLIVMSDGMNNGNPLELTIAQERIKNLVSCKKLAVYPFGVGKGADLNQLNQLSPKQKAFQLEETQMDGLFKWFAKSAVQISSGCVDGYTSPKLEYYEVVNWAEGL